MSRIALKIIPDSLNWEFQEACIDYWQNILREKESAWTSIVCTFFPEMMQCSQNKWWKLFFVGYTLHSWFYGEMTYVDAWYFWRKELEIDLSGFKKEEVRAELKDGYLTVSAETNTKKDEKAEDGKYIRRERYSGSCSRSFYVGEDVQQEDIKAEFKHGILKLFVPKKEAKPAVEEKKHIAIEG